MDNGIALYIHIPFCKQKCLYCDFPSYCGKENQMIQYTKALSKEINSIGNRKINTIFIGGGTPTYLSLEGWDILKNSIDNLNKSQNIEFTVECNPGTLSYEKLKFLKFMGVNRLSIGLQAWQNTLLKKLGRIHSREEFIENFKMARKLGFENINVDLMFGLPDQTLDEWKETLKEVVNLNPNHLSCYSLIIEEGTIFYSYFNNGNLKIPDEEIERKMYNYTLDFLSSKGFHQYEISNFSKDDMECKHNLVYWNLDEYIGCGSSAHSYSDGFRFKNQDNIDEYIGKINQNKSQVIEKKKNTLENDMEEFMFMGLRKIEGVSINKFNEKFNISIFEIYRDVIEKYKNQKLIIEDHGYLYLSLKGVEFSNCIMSDFMLI